MFLGKTSTQATFDGYLLGWGLDELDRRGKDSVERRAILLFQLLRDAPERLYDVQLVSEFVVEQAIQCITSHNRHIAKALVNSLAQDGFTIADDGDSGIMLRRTLPDIIAVPTVDDEVHELLKRHALTTSLGHLDQGITAHTRGDWAAANGQFRAFYESFFEEMAFLLDPVKAGDVSNSENRRQLLANLDPPFLQRKLNEWSDDGKNFVNGFLKRLHPQGSHPGLSDEDDSTFRLHLVLVTARLFLRRLDKMRGGYNS